MVRGLVGRLARPAQARPDRRSASSGPSRCGRSIAGQVVRVERGRMRQQCSAHANRRDAVVPLRPPLRSSVTAWACLLAHAPDALTCAPVGLALWAGLRPHYRPPGPFQGVGCANPRQRFACFAWRPQELARLRPAIRERACARVGTAVRCDAPAALPPRDARSGRALHSVAAEVSPAIPSLFRGL